MVGQVADLVSAEAVVGVRDFGFVVEVVVEMETKVKGYDFEVVAAGFVIDYVGEDNSDKMEDIDNIEKISHKYFHSLCPQLRLRLRLRLRPRLLPRIPVWWGLKIHLIVKSLILCPQPRSSCNKTKIFYRIWDCFLLKHNLKTWD